MNAGLLVLTIALGVIIALKALNRHLRRRRRRATAVGSMTLAASTNELKGLPEPEDRFEVATKGDGRVAYGCGHDGPTAFEWDLYGMPLSPSDTFHEKRDKCPQCVLDLLKEEHIRCVLCGHAILPGEPVALYGGGPGFRKKIATRVDGQWVGCLRRDCCPSGGFMAGHWLGKDGFRPAFGGMTAVGAAFATGKPVVGNVGKDGEMKITVLDDDDGSDEPPPAA